MATFFANLPTIGLGILGLLLLYAIVSLTAKKKSRFGEDCTGACANCSCGKMDQAAATPPSQTDPEKEPPQPDEAPL